MADAADRADRIISDLTERAISSIEVPDQSQLHDDCVDCGDEIPAPRRNMGYATCVPCQEDRELRAKGRA